jgi:hypothetical protein
LVLDIVPDHDAAEGFRQFRYPIEEAFLQLLAGLPVPWHCSNELSNLLNTQEIDLRLVKPRLFNVRERVITDMVPTHGVAEVLIEDS